MANMEPAVVDVAKVDNTSDYEGGNVDILRDADHIRARPGMYIGDNSTRGLHHLVYELVYNSVDEALAGFCKNINVRIHVDGSISVADDGRHSRRYSSQSWPTHARGRVDHGGSRGEVR